MNTLTKEQIIKEMQNIYNNALFWFNAAELDILDGTYFPTDPTKKKIPEHVRKRGYNVKKQNFVSAKEKINHIKLNHLQLFKEIGLILNTDERKSIIKQRKEIERIINACDSYISIFEKIR